MSRIFDANQPKAGANLDWAGRYLFALKELALATGRWSVVGSSDGVTWAYDGETAALAVADQGAGGDWDAWQAGASRSGSSPHVPGDAGNASAWCVLRHTSGRELLLSMTSQTSSNWDGYCRIAVARAGAGGFAGSAAGATTIPGTPAGGAGDEQWLHGARATADGVDVFAYNVAARIHMWADTDAEAPIGFYVVTSAGAQGSYLSIEPIAAQASSADPDPCAYLAAAAGAIAGWAWDWGGAAFRALAAQSLAAFWPAAGASDPSTGRDAIMPPVLVTTTGKVWKGRQHPTGIRMAPLNRGWGNYGADEAGAAWASTASNGIVIPWPDVVTVPLP